MLQTGHGRRLVVTLDSSLVSGTMTQIWALQVLALYILAFLASTTSAGDDPCTVLDGNKFYDLNPLKSE